MLLYVRGSIGKILTLVATIALSACSSSAVDEGGGPGDGPPGAGAGGVPKISVVTVMPRPVTIWDELPGRVSPFRIAEIRPQVSGLIVRRLFEEGAEVKAGQPLFEIDPESFEADVASAEATLSKSNAALSQAKANLERSQTLLDSANISRQAFDEVASTYMQAEADVAVASAALEKARISLRLTTVTAPIDGRIGAALISEGSLADAAATSSLATIQQVDRVYVDIRQPASRLQEVRALAQSGVLNNAAGIPVEILVGSDDSDPVSATALFSDITVDEGTGNVRMRVVADNKQQHLLPGMFVRAKVPRGTNPDAVLVPQQAVVRDIAGRPGVYVVDTEGTASRVEVVLGEQIEGQYLVRSGLSSGQRIVVEGQDKLTDAGPVEAVAYEPPAPAAAQHS